MKSFFNKDEKTDAEKTVDNNQETPDYKKKLKAFFIKEDAELAPLTNPDNPENLVQSSTGIENLDDNDNENTFVLDNNLNNNLETNEEIFVLDDNKISDNISDDSQETFILDDNQSFTLDDSQETFVLDNSESNLNIDNSEENFVLDKEDPYNKLNDNLADTEDAFVLDKSQEDLEKDPEEDLPKRPTFIPLDENEILEVKESLDKSSKPQEVPEEIRLEEVKDDFIKNKLSKKEEFMKAISILKQKKKSEPAKKEYTVDDLKDHLPTESESLDAHIIPLKQAKRATSKEIDDSAGNIYTRLEAENTLYYKAAYWGMFISFCFFVLISAFYGYEYISIVFDPSNNLDNGASFLYPYQDALSYDVAQFVWILSGFVSVFLIFYALARSFSCIITGLLFRNISNSIVSFFYFIVFSLGMNLLLNNNLVESFIFSFLGLFLIWIVIKLFDLKTGG